MSLLQLLVPLQESRIILCSLNIVTSLSNRFHIETRLDCPSNVATSVSKENLKPSLKRSYLSKYYNRQVRTSLTAVARARNLRKINEICKRFGRAKHCEITSEGVAFCRFHCAATKRLGLPYLKTGDEAVALVSNLKAEERTWLLNALQDQNPTIKGYEEASPTREQIKQLFIINCLPFVGFGFLDNFIMIIAGEYIDQSLGVWLHLSTMAAAALGNTFSDAAGLGLSHYVEFIVLKSGFKYPVLTSKQLKSPVARRVTNVGRAVGIIVGCLIGMFPLIFFK